MGVGMGTGMGSHSGAMATAQPASASGPAESTGGGIHEQEDFYAQHLAARNGAPPARAPASSVNEPPNAGGFGFGEGVSIDFRLTRGGKTEERTHPVVDQFAGETAYFSDCILEDREPEPNGEEGVLDMIVIEAIERALETGQPQALEPRNRQRRMGKDQVRDFPLADVPDFVNAATPTG